MAGLATFVVLASVCNGLNELGEGTGAEMPRSVHTQQPFGSRDKYNNFPNKLSEFSEAMAKNCALNDGDKGSAIIIGASIERAAVILGESMPRAVDNIISAVTNAFGALIFIVGGSLFFTIVFDSFNHK